MEPVLARRAGRGVVAVIVVERRSSKRDVYEKYSRIRISGPWDKTVPHRKGNNLMKEVYLD